jgi:Reverse transcriptase (RNA-dependent DNA polymerase)
MDWIKAINIDRALSNVHTDIIGDWYYDPWGWAELTAGQRLVDTVVQRLNSKGVRDTATIDVAKHNFGTRPAVVMDPIDRLAYQALVDTTSKVLIGDMSANAYGWRLDPKKPAPGVYVRDDHQWQNYLAHLSHLAQNYRAVLTTDIVSFFASVPVNRVIDGIYAVQKPNAVAGRLAEMLQAWDQQLSRKGLPQRCRASSVLANMYIRPIDDLLTKMCKGKSGLAWTRWMDDIWLFGNKPGKLRRVQTEINDRMRELNLQLNDSKNELLEGDEVAAAAERLEKRGVEYLLQKSPDDSTPLEEVIEREVLEDPSAADRTVIRYATHRLRRHKFWKLVEKFDVDVLERAPQGADHFARMFRDSDQWVDLENWYTTSADLIGLASTGQLVAFAECSRARRNQNTSLSTSHHIWGTRQHRLWQWELYSLKDWRLGAPIQLEKFSGWQLGIRNQHRPDDGLL